MKIDVNNYFEFYFVNNSKYLRIEEVKNSYAFSWKVVDVRTNVALRKFETFEQMLLYLFDEKYSVVSKKDIFNFDLLVHLRPAESEFIANILEGVKNDCNFKYYFRNLSKSIINKIKNC